MEKTLVHEDIYAYIDSVKEITGTQKGKVVKFINDARESIVDNGIFNIKITSGEFGKLVINDGYKDVSITNGFVLNSSWVLNFRDMHFIKDGTQFFLDDVIELKDDEYNVITLTFMGISEGEATVKYTRLQSDESYDDLMYLESISVDSSIERPKKTLLSGKEKTLKSEKKVHSFSINVLWSQEEVSKFTNLFRMRLVDEEGNKLDTLANCLITSGGKSSSSGGDLTYAISGSCEKIY